MTLLVAALIVAGALWWAARAIVRELQAERGRAAQARAIQLLQAFAPAIVAAQGDPRAVLVWQPLALTARKVFPEEFATLDRVAGGTFPFSKEQIEGAHARWTAGWLAWEQRHDAEFKMKAAQAEHDLAASGGSPLVRARLEAIEREKLESYQRRRDHAVAECLQSPLAHGRSGTAVRVRTASCRCTWR